MGKVIKSIAKVVSAVFMSVMMVMWWLWTATLYIIGLLATIIFVVPVRATQLIIKNGYNAYEAYLQAMKEKIFAPAITECEAWLDE